MKTVYLYDENGLYTGTYDAQENPVRPGAYIKPDLSTDIAPDHTDKAWPKFFSGLWGSTPDNRGRVFDTVTGAQIEHDELGDLPSNLTAIAKPDGFYKWSGTAWVVDLAAAKTAKNTEIKADCSLAIAAGISSDALGSTYTYPTTPLDQANLTGLITSSLLPNYGDEYKFWCADLNGIWARRSHTKLQIQEVGKSVVYHVIFQQEKYEQKLSEIALADEESLALIAW